MEPGTFQPGDICLDCQQLGLNNILRTFFIDLNEQIVKCESSSCLYPYENDFSDSDDERAVQQIQSSYTKQLSTLLPIDADIYTDDLDDTESERFVEALLCIGNNGNSAQKSVPKENIANTTVTSSRQTEIFKASTLLGDTMENNKSSVSLKPENVEQKPHSNEAFDVTKGASFIDALYSDCKSDNSTEPTTKSLDSQQNSQELSAACDMPILSFDLTDLSPTTSPYVAGIKNEINPKIHIENVKTIKTKTLPCSFKCDLVKASKSVDFIKPVKSKQQLGLATVAVAPANTSNVITATPTNSENKIRISRYFDALRERQEKLEKSNIKHVLAGRRKRNNSKKLPHVQATRSVMNVIEVLQTKKQK